MGCGAADREAPSIRQTAAEASPKAGEPSRRRIRGAAALLLFTALVVFFQYFPLHRAALVWQPSWFETGEISLLAYVGSREDRQTARPVLDLAEQAFSPPGPDPGGGRGPLWQIGPLLLRPGRPPRDPPGSAHPGAVVRPLLRRLWPAVGLLFPGGL